MKTTDNNCNPIGKSMGNSMEADFACFLYGQTTQVPDYLLVNYGQLGLSERSLIDLLRVLACCEKGSRYVRFELLLRQWQGQEQELRAALAVLLQQGVLARTADTAQECFKLDGLYEKMLELWVFQHSVPAQDMEQQTGKPEQELAENIKAAYRLFEGELARPLSPLEMEKLNCWLIADNWPLPMLREAMQRAVMHGAASFAYIDKILLRWRRAGIRTPEQLAEEDSNKHFGKKNDNKADKKTAVKRQNQAAEAGFASQTDYSKYFGV